jgi:hypothetical protein
MQVKKGVFAKDRKEFGLPLPPCMKAKEVEQIFRTDNLPPVTRGSSLGRFVLDSLMDAAKSIRDDYFVKNDELKLRLDKRIDETLIAPLKRVQRFVQEEPNDESIRTFLNAITTHVNLCFEEYMTRLGRRPDSNSKRRSIVDEVVLKFQEPVAGEERMPFDVPEMKASIAYERSLSKPGTTAQGFPFDVAHAELCAIKASDCGMVPVSKRFADFLMLQPLLVSAALAEN